MLLGGSSQLASGYLITMVRFRPLTGFGVVTLPNGHSNPWLIHGAYSLLTNWGPIPQVVDSVLGSLAHSNFQLPHRYHPSRKTSAISWHQMVDLYPPKTNIDNTKWFFGKCISFQTWLFWVSMLGFRGVHFLKLTVRPKMLEVWYCWVLSVVFR